MSRTLYTRLVAYRAFGERLGVLPEPVSFDASLLHNDSGALSVEYSALSDGAGLLDRQLTDGLEIALEVSDGTGYVEPDNARFVITGRSGKTDDRTGTVKYTGQCIQWLLSKAKMLDTQHLLTDGDNKGKRPFYSSNPGTILKTLMDENAARGGVAAGLTLGFDTAKDAGGDGWAKKYTLYYSLGVDLQSALSSLVQGGGCDWRTRERRLDIYNADSGKLSSDLSKSVILQLGRDISEAPYEESISSLASTILVEGDNSLVFTMDNPAAPHPWGKWESYVSQGGVSDKVTATAFMEAQLSDAARVRGQYTRSVITTGDITHLPLVDYHAGDWITAPTVSHAEKTRVQEIDVSMRQGDGLTVSLALNDVKYDASVRQSKRMQGITGGASLAGSQGGKASSEHDHRVASAPAGLTATTTAYLDSTGHARGLATVQWAAVTTATDGTALEVNGYTVEWRKHVDGAPWHAAGTTDKTTLGISQLDCGTQVEIRVRANATYSDQPGAWATPVVVTVENDVTPCSVPSKPVLSSALGVVTIHWDGKTDAGASMESDFDHVEVGRGTTTNDLTPIAATQSGQGDYLDTTRDPGTTWAYAFRSVDHSGNASDWSQTTSVEVASILSNQEIKDNITDPLNKAKADIAAAEASMNDLTKTVSSVDGKATTSGSAPTTSDASGKPDGAMWYVMDASGNITATYILKSGSWVKYAWASSSISDKVNQAISDAASAASTAQATADAAKSAAETNSNDLTSFINETTDSLASLQSQVDGSITTWFYSVAPTLSNKPAVDWTTTDMKNKHLGDLYYDTVTGYCYRYQVANNTYSWSRISDVDVTKALSDAAKAQDTADSKRRVFTGTPSTPYDVGDLWVQGASGDILTCSTAKTGSQSYNATDWKLASKYTDDTLAGQAHQAAVTAQESAVTAQTAADNAKSLANTAQSSADTAKTIAVAAQSAADAANSAAKDAQSAATAAQTTADGKSKVVRSTSAPSSTSGYSAGDQWWVYSGGTVTALYLYDGTAWVSQTLTNSVIANLDAGKITSGYVNADRIQAGSITGAKVAAGTITASNMVAGTLTAASGIIADAAIGSAQIIDGSIGTAEIADAAISSAKIADAAISSAKIADASITNAKIASLDAGKITSGYVDAARIAANSITADKLLVGRGGDYSPNPTFDPSGTLIGTPHPWIPGNGGHSVQLTGRDNIFPASTAFPVTKGDTFYITCEATHQSGTAPLKLGLWWTVTPSTATSIQAWTNMTFATDLGQSANDPNWHTYAATISVPTAWDAVVTAARGVITMDAGLAGEETVWQNTWLIGNYHIYKVSDGTLIADGSISTNKLVANAVTADKLAANSVTADKIAAGTITSDKVAAGQFTGYVFTGAVFQSSEAVDTGIKINSTALQMWDSQHHRTVYLDGEGKNNVLTGSFQTAATGNRIEIDSQATSTLIGGSTSLSGQSIVFHAEDFAGSPKIYGFFTNSDLGDAPRISINSGWKTDHDPAATLIMQSWPRSKGATGSGITSEAMILANTDYTEPDPTKKSYASLDLKGIGGSGAYAKLEAHAYAGSEAQTWVTATRDDGVTQVGIGADAFTQSIYLGGKLGGITDQQTFQTNNWKAYWGTTPAGGTLYPVTVALKPARYGVYHSVASSDCEWGSIFIHVSSTGNASQYQVMGFNAGTGAFNGDVWVDAIAWLT